MTERMSAVQAWELAQSSEACIVDVRGPSRFALGHPRGALSLPFSQKGLGERLRVLLEAGTPVILVTENPEQSESALSQLLGDAFQVLFEVEGGMEAWCENGLPTEVLHEISIQEITEAASEGSTVVLDVRESIEWEMGHIPGAMLISLGALRDRLNEVPGESRIIVICEAGIRSSSAASILQAAGFADVVNVPEGTGGYRNAGLPIEVPEDGSFSS